MSELAPHQSDLDYLSGKVDIAGAPTTIVKEEFIPGFPDTKSKPTGADDDKEVKDEEVNLNLPGEGLNLNLPEDDKDTDPEPPEAETEALGG